MLLFVRLFVCLFVYLFICLHLAIYGLDWLLLLLSLISLVDSDVLISQELSIWTNQVCCYYYCCCLRYGIVVVVYMYVDLAFCLYLLFVMIHLVDSASSRF